MCGFAVAAPERNVNVRRTAPPLPLPSTMLARLLPSAPSTPLLALLPYGAEGVSAPAFPPDETLLLPPSPTAPAASAVRLAMICPFCSSVGIGGEERESSEMEAAPDPSTPPLTTADEPAGVCVTFSCLGGSMLALMAMALLSPAGASPLLLLAAGAPVDGGQLSAGFAS